MNIVSHGNRHFQFGQLKTSQNWTREHAFQSDKCANWNSFWPNALEPSRNVFFSPSFTLKFYKFIERGFLVHCNLFVCVRIDSDFIVRKSIGVRSLSLHLYTSPLNNEKIVALFSWHTRKQSLFIWSKSIVRFTTLYSYQLTWLRLIRTFALFHSSVNYLYAWACKMNEDVQNHRFDSSQNDRANICFRHRRYWFERTTWI